MEQSYPPSWVDRLTDWVERLPGPSWLAYLGVWFALFLLLNAAKWLDGSQPPGIIEPRHAARAVHGVYFLALLHYLRGAAGAAIDAFRPALTASEAEYARLHYRLTTLPARRAFAAAGIGAVAGGLGILLNPLPPNPAYATSPLVAGLDIGMVMLDMLVLGVLVYQTLHQLTTTSRIHATATRINLFRPDPLYAFSGLTARIAVGYILIAELTFAFMHAETARPATAGLLVFMISLALAVFDLPLLGMHRRMIAEKKRLKAEANQRLELAITELHRRVDAGDLTNMVEVQRAMAALEIERDAVAKLSTWPWRSGTLPGLLSALLFPVVVWLVERLLLRFLGS